MRRPNEYRALIAYGLWRDPLHSIEENKDSGWERADMKQCYKFLDMTSRSFSAVIKELEGDLSRVVTIFYLVLRGLDTIEDDMTLSNDVKLPLLLSFHEKLYERGWNFKDSGPNEKDAPLLVDFQCVITEFLLLSPEYQKAIASVTKSMGEGMALYAASPPDVPAVTTPASYDLYCHYVAGLVGEGLSALFSVSGLESAQLQHQLSLSNAMGLLLQKTNITRDICEDTADNRVFWPASVWSKYAPTTQALLALSATPEGRQQQLWSLSEMIVDALTHATDALDYLTLLKTQSVFNFCSIPQVMAIATLDVCFMNPKVFTENVKIRKGRAVQLIMDATNPRDVAYIFRDHMRSIHAKAVPSDPSFLKLCILAGRIEQWTETRYPSFVVLRQPLPTSADDWRPGMDARILQLTDTTDEKILETRARAKEVQQSQKMSGEDYKFLALVMGGMLVLVGVMVGIAALGVWLLVLREGAPYADSLGEKVVATAAARVKEEL